MLGNKIEPTYTIEFGNKLFKLKCCIIQPRQ